MDVTDKDSIQQAKEQLTQKEGKLNVLVNKCVPTAFLLHHG